MKKINIRTIFTLVGSIFFVVGLILMVVGGIKHIEHNNFMDTAETVQATISEIEEDVYYRKGRRRIRHYAWASYTVDGNYYNRKLDHYSSTMYVGARIWVYYDPANPSDVRTGSNYGEIILFGMGGVFVIIGGVFLIIVVTQKRKIKTLKLNGEQLTGTIKNVVQNRNMRINGRHPFKAEVELKNPFDGETYLYSSESINTDISQFIGSQVTVYVDKNKKSRYYVDMESLMNQYNEKNKIHDYR